MREDVRLTDLPMRPLACGSCGAIVEVRKSSWDQTSVQWHSEALEACLERRASTAAFTGCSSLRASVREAAVRGDLPVPDS